MPLKQYRIPCTVIEKGRIAIINAESKTDALRMFRQNEWDELCDADEFIVRKTGKVEEVKS